MRMLLTLTWQDTLRAVVDIAIVATCSIRHSFSYVAHGQSVAESSAVLFVLVQVTDFLRLHTIKWLLDRVSDMLFVAIPVVFSAEIRRALERLGKGSLFTRSLFLAPAATPEQVVGEIAEAAGNLSRDRTGALIVVQREVGLMNTRMMPLFWTRSCPQSFLRTYLSRTRRSTTAPLSSGVTG